MSRYFKTKNKEYWNRLLDWKSDLAKIKSPEFPQHERNDAFLRLRGQLQGVYKRTARSYAGFLWQEGHEVSTFLDEILFRCATKFNLSRHGFFNYFCESVRNAIKLVYRDRTESTEELNEEIVSKGEVHQEEAALLWCFMKALSPSQRRIVRLLLNGKQHREIKKRFALNRHEFDQTMSRIRGTAREILEVKNGI